MNKPDLYICHTMLQVLTCLVRALRAGGGQAVWLADTVPDFAALRRRAPDADDLVARLRDTGAFAEVSLVDQRRWPGTVTGPLAHLRGRRAYEKAGCGPVLDKNAYRDIYISNDWSVLGRYLQDCRAPYILCEDTVGSTLDPDQHLLEAQRAAPGFAACQRSGRGYLYWGDSRWCKLVESEDAARCRLFAPEKLVTFRRMAMLQSLTEEEKAAVRHVFLRGALPENTAGATLLLPRSFVLDGLLDQPAQDAMFKAVAARYADGPLFIKTHPRDQTDYRALFPDAVVLDRRMPSEVLNFCLPFRFRRAVTVQSWVLRGFTAADEKILLTLDEALALTGQKETKA